MVPPAAHLGGLSLISFIYIELSVAEVPLVPVRRFAKRSLWSIAAATFLKDIALMAVRNPSIA